MIVLTSSFNQCLYGKLLRPFAHHRRTTLGSAQNLPIATRSNAQQMPPAGMHIACCGSRRGGSFVSNETVFRLQRPTNLRHRVKKTVTLKFYQEEKGKKDTIAKSLIKLQNFASFPTLMRAVATKRCFRATLT